MSKREVAAFNVIAIVENHDSHETIKFILSFREPIEVEGSFLVFVFESLVFFDSFDQAMDDV